MTALKTLKNDASPEGFIHQLTDLTRQQDSLDLLKLYTTITGKNAVMWGTSIIGFGQYHYKSDRSSQEGDWPLIAFSPRKQSLSLYFMPGFENYTDLLSKLGKHKVGKACLYINRLSDIDRDVLRQLIERAYKDSQALYK